MNKLHLVWIALVISSAPLWAQRKVERDSLVSLDNTPSPLSPELAIIPSGLIATGIIVNEMKSDGSISDRSFQRWFSPSDGKRENVADDYIQFLPVTAALAVPLVSDVPHRSSMGNLAVKTLVSEVTTMGLVSALKFGINKDRPNGGKNSFPSGHTAQAFMGAQILYLEYRDTNKWIAYSGYPVAAFVGMERVMNNMHWQSDVLAGAGIGMLMPTVVYWVDDKLFSGKRAADAAKKKTYTVSLVPIVDGHTTGVGVNIEF